MKRLILAISVALVLGLAAAAIAYNRTAVAETAMSCRCCSGGSCPMKKGEASHATMTAEEHQAMQADGKACCCACCKSKQSA